jgi:hypothetical protein
MADTKGSVFTSKTSPLPSDSVTGVDSTGPTNARFTMQTLHLEYTNQSVANQGAGFATDTYLTGSNITIPTGAPFVGTTYKLTFNATKTAVGTAAPVVILRIGTAGTTTDTAICTFTFGVGTAVADTGWFEVIATFRTVGSGTTAVVQGISRVNCLPSSGISSTIKAVAVTSSGFNSTTAGLIIGASYNGGTSAVHTVNLVRAELML